MPASTDGAPHRGPIVTWPRGDYGRAALRAVIAAVEELAAAAPGGADERVRVYRPLETQLLRVYRPLETQLLRMELCV
eukprot:gene21500-30096_t